MFKKAGSARALSRYPTRGRAGWLLWTAGFVLLAVAQNAQAQPAREGDVYNGLNHQPTRAEVTNKEKADGMAVPKTGPDSELEQLDRKLLHDEAVSPPTAVTPPAPVR